MKNIFTKTFALAAMLMLSVSAMAKVYCHEELTNGSQSIYLSCSTLSDGTYRLVIDGNNLAGLGGSFFDPGQVDLRSTVVLSNKHKIVCDITAASAPVITTPLYVMINGEKQFAWPNDVEWENTCSLYSEYNNYQGAETKTYQQGGYRYCTITWTTDDNGDVVVTIGDGDNTTNAHWRNNNCIGGLNNYKVISAANPDGEDANTYFTFERINEITCKFTRNSTPLPAGLIQLKQTGGALEWACDEFGDEYNNGDRMIYTYGGLAVNTPVEGIVFTPNEITIMKDESQKLVPVFTPANATNKKLSWLSDAPAVASVNNGVVTAKTIGDAVITATTQDGGFTATCTIHVIANTLVPSIAAPTVVTTGYDSYSAIYNDDENVTLAVAHGFMFNPWGGAAAEKRSVSNNEYILFSTESSTDATIGVNNDGNDAIIAKAGYSDPDDANHKGIYAVGKEYLHLDVWTVGTSNKFEVRLNDYSLTQVALTGTATSGQWQSINIDITEVPEDKLNNIRWMKFYNMPANSKVAIDNIYFWKSAGTAPVTGVTLDHTSATLEIGESITLHETVLPADAANKNVTWLSNNDHASVVDGVVTAVTPGESVITVTTEDGNFTATCTITVNAIEAKTLFKSTMLGDMYLAYSITRNEDRTLTYAATTVGGNPTVHQVNDGQWHTLVNNENVWSWTSEATYAKDDKVTAFWYFPARYDFTYYVASVANTYTRENLTVGNYGTLALPFNATVEGATLYEVTAVGAESITLTPVEDNIAEAGKGYVFKATATTLTATYTAVAALASSDYMVSNYTDATVRVAGVTSEKIYILSGGELHKVNDGVTVNVGEHRAYFNLGNISNAPSRMSIILPVATGVENNAVEMTATKKMVNGQVIIIKNGVIYNALGQLIK